MKATNFLKTIAMKPFIVDAAEQIYNHAT